MKTLLWSIFSILILSIAIGCAPKEDEEGEAPLPPKTGKPNKVQPAMPSTPMGH